MTQPLPAEATQAEFARLLSWRPSYVTQLKQAGRLVLTDDGRRVRVSESLARIEATRDPSRAHVTERHAQARQPGQGEGQGRGAPRAAQAGVQGAAPAAAAQPPQADGDPEDAALPRSYAEAKAEREHYLALAARRDYEQSIGQLLEAAAVRSALADAGTTLRTRLESLRDILAPQLAPITDEARIRTLLSDEIEHVLAELARSFAKAAGGGE